MWYINIHENKLLRNSQFSTTFKKIYKNKFKIRSVLRLYLISCKIKSDILGM